LRGPATTDTNILSFEIDLTYRVARRGLIEARFCPGIHGLISGVTAETSGAARLALALDAFIPEHRDSWRLFG
jgi:hypothetical protein